VWIADSFTQASSLLQKHPFFQLWAERLLIKYHFCAAVLLPDRKIHRYQIHKTDFENRLENHQNHWVQPLDGFVLTVRFCAHRALVLRFKCCQRAVVLHCVICLCPHSFYWLIYRAQETRSILYCKNCVQKLNCQGLAPFQIPFCLRVSWECFVCLKTCQRLVVRQLATTAIFTLWQQ
jgi:hypothetical protein